MKSKIVILTPVYNDWKNLNKLLKKINHIFRKDIKDNFDLVIVNDCSKEYYNCKKYKFKTIGKINLINLKKNVGSQRAIAIGVKYLSDTYKKRNLKTIIMDSDGQDNPRIISKMISISKNKPRHSIVINRGQRKEQFWFRFFYEVYCFVIKIFYFKKIRFGHFSLLNFNHLKKISKKAELWSAYPPTLSKNINQLIHLTVNREKRYSGNSKMNFFGLLKHAFRVFSALKLKILISSSIYFFLFFVIIFKDNKLLLFLLTFGLITFNLINFLISINNKSNFSKNYKKAKIKIYKI